MDQNNLEASCPILHCRPSSQVQLDRASIEGLGDWFVTYHYSVDYNLGFEASPRSDTGSSQGFYRTALMCLFANVCRAAASPRG